MGWIGPGGGSQLLQRMEGGMHSGHATSIKNGLIPSKDAKNLELILRDVDAKGCLDLELLFQLKKKEKVRGIEKEITDRIEHPLEEGTPLFQRGFEEFLFLSKRILYTSTEQKKPTPDEGGGFLVSV